MSGAVGFLQEAAGLQARGVGWAGLPSDALAFVLARTVGAAGALVVVDEPDAAERLVQALDFFATADLRVHAFPADDVRPYDGFSPSSDVVGARVGLLDRIDRGHRPLVVASVAAVLQHVPDAGARRAAVRIVRPGDRLDRDALITHLTHTGHLAADRVRHPGTFAVRGDVVDVWSVSRSRAVRIDFFDDDVESVRRLDPSGRPDRTLVGVRLLPAREERLASDAVDRLRGVLADQVASQGRGRLLRRRLVEEMRAGIRFSAIEDYLPGLVPTEPGLDALAVLPLIVVHPTSVAASAREWVAMAHRRWSELDADERPLVPPSMRWADVDTALDTLGSGHPVYELAGTGDAVDLGARPLEGFGSHGAELGPVAARLRKLAGTPSRLGIVVDSERRLSMLEDLLAAHDIRLVGRASPDDLVPGEVSVLVGDLPRGFDATRSGWAFVAASALFGGGDRAVRRRAHDLFDEAVAAVTELKDGDLVVHRLHGIGRYEGLVRLEVGGGAQDFVRVVYRGGDLLYVPATDLGQLSTYRASRAGVEVRLDKLGGRTWASRKGKVRDALLSKAQELIALEARRELATRPPHPAPGAMAKTLAARFPHTETPDQAQAIVDVHDDLSADTPMDRLICGDVGFGKTEVAMRAAVRVVEGGRQVAVVCPTTVLALQHLRTFQERFDDLPVRVEMLSRFTTPAEATRIKRDLAKGAVDIVIGTHALWGRGVRWRDLGLVVVDEEHRFGVGQKARLKKLRAEVDVLAMSATPIPRTLQMVLSGVRPMSVMATPPADRLSTRTTIARWTRTRVRDALLLELQRKGQAYVVHNRVASLEAIAHRVEEWVPETRVRIAHGQMPNDQLERVLIDFVDGAFDVLVCTAIVESGVDMPNVNTMLVHRADLFGLSQLYQLRGRVGRSSTRGNCVLFTPEEVPRDARRRLQVMVENTRLGSGFHVAAADLELRGGGNLLGDAQSGHIDAVGYQVWVELLEEAIGAARGRADQQRLEPEIEVGVPAFLPEQILPDLDERLGWYRRFGEVRTPDEADRLVDELETIAGDLPSEVHHLAGRIQATLLCRELGISRVSWLKVRVLLEVHPASHLVGDALERACAAHPRRMSLEGEAPTVLAVRFTPKEAERPFLFLRWLFARLEASISR